MINNIPRTAKTDALTSLLRSDLPDLGEIQVSVVETSPDRSGEADSLTLFLNEANRWPRLIAEEELRLGRLIKAGKDLDGNLTSAAQAAFDELVNRNLRLSYHAAKQMRVPREEMMELERDVSSGMAKVPTGFAIQKTEPMGIVGVLAPEEAPLLALVISTSAAIVSERSSRKSPATRRFQREAPTR